MNFRRLAAAPLLAIAIMAADAPAQAAPQLSRSGREMQTATLEAYNKIVAENPSDLQTLYRRAHLFYNRDQYGAALTDVTKVISQASAKQTDLLFDALSLRGATYERLGKYDLAIKDYKRAVTMRPKDYSTRYQLANTEFAAGDLDAAKADYQALRRLNPRSQEACFGLAHVAYAQGNTAEANRLVDEGVAINPTAAVSYLRQAAVYRQMDRNIEAVEAYTVALNLDRHAISPALTNLMEMAQKDYDVVMQGLQSAIDKHPRNGTLYYIRGMLAKRHFHYAAALKDFNHIMDGNLMSKGMVAMDAAECLYNLADYDHALQMADYAIGSANDNTDAYIIKSRIKAAQEAWKAAVENADRALAKNPENARALMARGLALQGLTMYPEASIAMGNAILIDDRAPWMCIDRAWLLANCMDNAADAETFYQQAAAMDFSADNVCSLQGFANLALGHTEAAEAWMQHLTADVPDPDGQIAYYAACFYAHRGDLDKAFTFMERSLNAGYSSLHNWRDALDGGVNTAPLRQDPRFQQLLDAHSSLWAH